MIRLPVALNAPNRASGIDVLRGLAVVAVVLYHFDALPYGYLGVDLFFVISGVLVSKPLIDGRTGYGRFVLLRGFKIWPSYYAFLAGGMALAWVLFRHSRTELLIPAAQATRYILFYENYRGTQAHWIFDHVWSLCVEEHFYLLLPAVFLVTRARTARLVLALLAIVGGSFALRWIGYAIGKDYQAATHSCIDGLAIGVLARLAIERGGETVRKLMKADELIVAGVVLCALAITLYARHISAWFDSVLFHGLARVGFALIALRLFAVDLRRLRALRFVSYYSYNLYLWHPLISVAARQYLHSFALALGLYLCVSLGIAMLVTHYVEEPGLALRARLMDPRRERAIASQLAG